MVYKILSRSDDRASVMSHGRVKIKKVKKKVDSKWATKKMFYRWKEKALNKPGNYLQLKTQIELNEVEIEIIDSE